MKTGIRFIFRNTVQHVGEHRENLSISLRQKQSRNSHPKERGRGHPLIEERTRELIKPLIWGGSSWSVSSSGQLSCFTFHT